MENEIPAADSITAAGASPAESTGSVDATAEFTGDVSTNDAIPSLELLRKVQDFSVFDKDGKSLSFKSIYSGPNVPRRVLVIFVRHFFCGNCQEYLRTLSSSITPESLLQLPTPTFIAIIGCGSPSLISVYQDATSCPFPIYADPTRKLYDAFRMTSTLALGPRPEYMRRSLLSSVALSVVQVLKQVKSSNATKGGDIQQVGGEFLFEPLSFAEASVNGLDPPTPLSPLGNDEEKTVTWCHRMRNTRDHAEIPELREVLGLDGLADSGKNSKRWDKALGTRKGTALSTVGSVGKTNQDSGTEAQSSDMAVDNGA